jgi:hypothetical protein
MYILCNSCFLGQFYVQFVHCLVLSQVIFLGDSSQILPCFIQEMNRCFQGNLFCLILFCIVNLNMKNLLKWLNNTNIFVSLNPLNIADDR